MTTFKKFYVKLSHDATKIVFAASITVTDTHLKLDRIIEGCRNGEAEARCELYGMLSGAMFGLIRRYIRDESTAEDLLHDGFVTVYTKIGEYRGSGSFEGWCRRIFINTVMGYFRQRNPLDGAEDVTVARTVRTPEPSVLDTMSAAEIKECIDMLPAGYRTIFNLHAVDGYEYREIAGMLEISEATVRSQYLRARMKLAEIISRRLDEA